jgi:hypothetical protein
VQYEPPVQDALPIWVNCNHQWVQTYLSSQWIEDKCTYRRWLRYPDGTMGDRYMPMYRTGQFRITYGHCSVCFSEIGTTH